RPSPAQPRTQLSLHRRGRCIGAHGTSLGRSGGRMSEREARPAALRVQVADVAMRASLVSVTPPASDPGRSASKPPSSPVPPEAAVERRAVRVISDPPPGFDEKRVLVPASSASSADSGPPSGLTAVPNDHVRALNGKAETAAATYA